MTKPAGFFKHTGPLESHICPDGIWEECFEGTPDAIPLYQMTPTMASADDLLAALGEMVAAYQGDLPVPERKVALHNARAAISKAKGKQL